MRLCRQYAVDQYVVLQEYSLPTVLRFLRKASASSTKSKTPFLLLDAQSNTLCIAVTPSLPIGAISPPVIIA